MIKSERFSKYKVMWLLVLFDLPVVKEIDRKRATKFRQALLNDGFTMMQFSVYTRPIASKELAKVHITRIKNHLPPDGDVKIMNITDKQYSDMLTFIGTQKQKPQKGYSQLELF